MLAADKRVRLIRLTLLEGDPEGLRTVSIAGSTSVVTCCPLGRLAELKKRDEANAPAVYFLIGYAEGKPAIYVGECDSLAERFKGKHHALDKADFQQIVVASTSDETFNKAHARRAEHLLRQAAEKTQRADVLTDQTSPGKLSDGDAAYASSFADEVMVLSQVLGIETFRPAPSAVQSSAAVESEGLDAPTAQPPLVWSYRYGKQVVDAKMIMDGNRFVVLAGSKTRKTGTEDELGLNWGRELRTSALAAGIIVMDPDEGVLVFAKDYVAKTISAASSIIYGQNSTGPDAWYVANTDQSYRQWLLQQTQAGAP